MILRLILFSVLFFYSVLPSVAFDRSSIPNLESKKLHDSITHHQIKLKSNRGPIFINILELDLNDSSIEIINGTPSLNTIMSKDLLSNIATTHNAFLGINANYFDINTGTVLGLTKSQDDWLSGSIYNRAAIGFSATNHVQISRTKLIIDVRSKRDILRTHLYISCFNTPRAISMSICLYNSKYSPSFTPEKDDELALVQNKCISSIGKTTVSLKGDDVIIVGKKEDIKGIVKVGDCFDFDWLTEPDLSNAKVVVSGGPYLLKNSHVFVDDSDERLVFTGNNIYAPRTAIGIDQSNKLYLIAVDGRKQGYSEGMSLEELAFFLKFFGLKEAINLDGGGSTAMYVDGKIINSPSDGHERAISNALLVKLAN